MDETEAKGKLARGVIQVNIAAFTVSALASMFGTVLHGLAAFWASIHILPLIKIALERRNKDIFRKR